MEFANHAAFYFSAKASMTLKKDHTQKANTLVKFTEDDFLRVELYR